MVDGEWFEFDVEHLTSPKHADSWFDRMSAVAMALIIQWVRINFGFSAPGGKIEEPTEASCELLLIAVPTPPTSDNTRPPWQMDDISFSDLLQFAMDDGKPATLTSTDAVVNDLARAVEEVADVPNPLPATYLKDSIAAGEKFTSATVTAFEEATDFMPSPPFTQDPPTVLRGDPTQITAAKMYALDLSGSDVAYFTGNTATKVEIVLALAAQELEGWKMFRVMAEGKFKQWQEQIHKLESLRDLLRDQKREGETYVDNARDMHRHLAKLEEETEGVRHYRFASETLGGRHQRGMSPFAPTYLSGRTMQHVSPGLGKSLDMRSPTRNFIILYPSILTAARSSSRILRLSPPTLIIAMRRRLLRIRCKLSSNRDKTKSRTSLQTNPAAPVHQMPNRKVVQHCCRPRCFAPLPVHPSSATRRVPQWSLKMG
jgi:hypothetical protein